MIKALDVKQERQILELLKDAEFLNNGASRCVFNCSDEIAALLDIESDNYVIKLACGLGGVRQTEAEVKCFLNHPYAPLAEIVAYGRYVEVMERVECDDFRDFAEECDEDWGIPYETFYDYNGNDEEGSDADDARAEEAYDVIIQLHRIFGHTADNGQLGRNRHDNLVAYDYGFDTDLSCDEQTSEVSDYVYDTVQRNAYIDALINLLTETLDMLEAWEDNFLNGDNEVYDHNSSYAWFNYRVRGFTENGQEFNHNYRNENIARQVANQLQSYVIWRKQVRQDREEWRQHTVETIILDQAGDLDSIQQILEYEEE